MTINTKDFNKDGKLEDVNKVQTLIKDLHHVGDGTEEKVTFKEAITLEEVPDEYIFSFETDGSMSPQTAMKKAAQALSDNFASLNEDLSLVL